MSVYVTVAQINMDSSSLYYTHMFCFSFASHMAHATIAILNLGPEGLS